MPKASFLLSGVPTDFVGNGILLGGDAERVKTCRATAKVVALGVGVMKKGKSID